MPDAPVTADKEKLQAILLEKGLPAKVGARLNPTEQKIHDVLCAAYNFKTGIVALEIPGPVLSKCGSEFRKLWNIHPNKTTTQGKTEVLFSLTHAGIKQTIRTVLNKDSGIFSAKNGTVRLHESWARFLKTRDKSAGSNVDWSKATKVAQHRNERIKEDIMDGKTFNAQKDNPWARKNLKNRY